MARLTYNVHCIVASKPNPVTEATKFFFPMAHRETHPSGSPGNRPPIILGSHNSKRLAFQGWKLAASGGHGRSVHPVTFLTHFRIPSLPLLFLLLPGRPRGRPRSEEPPANTPWTTSEGCTGCLSLRGGPRENPLPTPFTQYSCVCFLPVT